MTSANIVSAPVWYSELRIVTQLTRNSDPATMRPSRSMRPRNGPPRSAGNSSSATQNPTGMTRYAASAIEGNGTSSSASS